MKLNVISPISNLSYGYVGQNIVKSLLKLGHTVNLQSIGPIEPDEVYAPYIERCSKELDDSPTLIIWHHFDLKRYVRPNVLNIGFPIFEVNQFSKEEIEQLNSVDMLFATCEWYQSVLRKYVSPPIEKIPLGSDPDVFFPVENPIPDETVRFLNIGKFEIRKGHPELIKMFASEFRSDEKVSLTLACDNPFIEEDNTKWAAFARKYIPLHQLNILPLRFNSCVDVAKLIAQHDIGVFPSRCEGWGLPVSEMISMDKRVIVTNYSAFTEYCNIDNADMINITHEEPCFDGCFFHGQGTWAQLATPQIQQLKYLFRKNFNAVQANRNVKQEKMRSTQNKLTWDETAKQITYVIGQQIK